MLDLNTYLARRTPEQTVNLLHFWGIAPPPQGKIHASNLLEQMRQEWSARLVWERLSTEERQVLGRLLQVTKGWLLKSKLYQEVPLPAQTIDSALQRFSELALAVCEMAKVQGSELFVEQQYPSWWRQEQPKKTRPVEEKEIVYPLPELRPTLRLAWQEATRPEHDRTHWLLGMLISKIPVEALLTALPRYGLAEHFAQQCKEDLVALFTDTVVHPAALERGLASLGQREQTLYRWLIAQGGRVPIADLRAQANVDEPTLKSLLRTWRDTLLAWDTFSQGERVVFIPKEIRPAFARLGQKEEPRPHRPALEATATPTAVQEGRTIFPWGMLVILTHLQREKVSLTIAENAVPRRVVDRLVEALGGDADLVERLLWCVRQWKLAATQAGRWLPVATNLDKWKVQSFPAQAKRFYELWLTHNEWSDGSGPKDREAVQTLDRLAASKRVVQEIRQGQSGIWYSLDTLVEALHQNDPFFARPKDKIIRTLGYGAVARAEKSWLQVEPHLIGQILTSLHRLGLLSLGYAAGSQPSSTPVSWQVTPLGAWVWGQSQRLETPPPSPQPLLVQANFDVLAFTQDGPTLYHLAHFCQPISHDAVSFFKLTRESVLGAIDTGLSGAEIMAFLEKNSRQPVPQNVVYSLREWAGAFKRVRLCQGTILEVDDEAVLETLLHDADLKDLVARRLGPRAVLLVSGNDLRSVERMLDRAGYAALPDEQTLAKIAEARAAAREREWRRW